ncbi:DUF3320 domain-containing protein [Chitinophaga sp. GbtcB8]|uniref:DUF3320 domain-containing protein n=1 Tax=Chitinophaga sp. GbtcB8 TaxID=2824753 RepID=UPI001C2F3E4E|nr:DUF3320 domain-containing protein [Chitinophaga sp. GbtcB8]
MSITITFNHLPVINFALQQNQVPVVTELSITNNSEDDWEQVTVEIVSEPDFMVAWSQTIGALKKEETWSLKHVALHIAPAYLAALTERIAGSFMLTVKKAGQQLFQEHYPIALLAYDQWNGISLMPEMLAAFITPNHPDIPGIIRKAAGILEKWTGSPSFDEYQTRNPNRVRKQMAAIYEAISELQLIYCSVPASFEETGQRVRLTDAIFANKLANCLDLSLLYAACLEAVGIHPFVVVVKGHAFTGAWLIDESFADTVNDDPSLLTKRTANGISEITLVEATCMNAGQNTAFDDAVRAADQKMLHQENFILFIDVKRARFSSIRPLPLRIATPTGWEIQEEALTARTNISPDDITVSECLLQVEKIEVTKQRLWERKLLDLTLRNSLLNTRITKSVIQFMTVHIGQLEDALADGEEFQILAKPTDWDHAIRDTGLYKALHQSDPVADLVKHELTHKRIRTHLSETELQAALTHVYRSSRLALEENGANTLYIGLGMLKWYETTASERARYAPILLIPVEIIRKSAHKGYVIRSREEETITNITLLEMLRQDFGITIGLETLPRDESGVDVKAVMNYIRQAVMSQPRWDVEEQAILGTFSFSKFILWNDIHHNAAELCKNKLVASLMSGKLEWNVGTDTSTAQILDGQLHPAQVALPISTDSSQLHAIVSSAQDKSFVLHGPPGTGKSQTITNIIANALYAGKRVLFVAAKKAALEVVESRLQSIGIAPFCLELHSNKAKKSSVLEQLKAATQITQKSSPENFQHEADRLFELRNELNVYVDALHKKHPLGYSLFDLFTAYSQLPAGEDQVYFPADILRNITPAQLSTWKDLAEEIQNTGLIIGHPQGHPLLALNMREYNTQLKQQARQLIDDYLQQLAKSVQAAITANNILQLEGSYQQPEQEEAIIQLASLLTSLENTPASLLQADPLEQTLMEVIQVAANGKKRDALRATLLTNWQKDLLNFQAAQTLSEWNLASHKWFLPRWLKQKAILKTLKSMSLTGQVDKQEVTAVLQNIIAYSGEQAIIDQTRHLPATLGFLWKNGECEWDTLIKTCGQLIETNRLAGNITGVKQLKEWRNRMAGEWAEGSKVYTAAHVRKLTEYAELQQQIKQTEAGLQQLLGIRNTATLHNNSQDRKADLIATAQQWLQNIDALKDWYNWTNVRARALQAGLQPLITAYENGSIQSKDLLLQYNKGLYSSAANGIIEQTPQLAIFNGDLFSEKIRKFRTISKQFETLTKEQLYARLAAKIPNFTQEASQSSEIGMLQRAIRNNGRAMSIRKIFDSIPNLLPRLTPCMLMSPISVAQYFDCNSVKFDLVIFDEASQMPTCEAVGAIARGSNVIVVGDPKQMPPTSFFSNNNIDEDNIEKEDLESILDDCLALSMPSQHLLWHYRSKHESLIAFSNAKYYENKLLTFPSTDDIASKVQFVPVDGFYDKGKTRQNHNEAKAIVNEVIRRLSDPVLAKRSMGIVTFSATQQILIDDLLTEVFAARPELEKIALETEEPLFIKNLENVQGDERDIILFSIGYGPDKEGKISLNFGPINRDGGWRRLNVAVSRARYEMKVFSTLRSDQIDLNRTSAEGVAGLKAFLAYAEKGKTALPIRSLNKHNESFSFETVIAEEIKKHGYDVHTHIGCSAYRIDIGIVDPKDPSKYVLAVLTDGKNYYNATTSKDREMIQVDVLHQLGWKVHKIWSVEWWENPGKVLNGIIDAIDHTHTATTSEPSLQVQVATTINNAPQPSFTQHLVTPSAVPYQISQVNQVITSSSEEFLFPENRGKIKDQIFDVLEAESPISKNLLCKRVLAAWGISRMGTRINFHFEGLFNQLDIEQTTYGDKTFFWKKGQQAKDFTVYRIAATEAAKRDADDLPPEEIATAVREILKNQISLSQPDLIREAAKAFGYARIGANVENAMLLGINKAIDHGYAMWKNDRIVYNE